jgi:cytochrome P450
MLCHPSHAQHVFIDQARNYSKEGPLWDSIRTLIGNGLVVSQGDLWKRQRRMMNPHFHHSSLAHLADLMVKAIDEGMLPGMRPRLSASRSISPRK